MDNGDQERPAGTKAGVGPSAELLSPAEASPVLAALADPRETVRTAAFRAATGLPLSPTAEVTIDALARKLLDGRAAPDESVARHDLVVCSAQLRPADIQARVRRILAEGSAPDRHAAAEGLAVAGDPVVVPELLQRLWATEPRVRAWAAQALAGPALVRVKGVVDALRHTAVRDRSSAVALSAAVGVARTGDATWLVDVLRRIRDGELDLSGLEDRPVAFTTLPSDLQADLAEFTSGRPDDVAGVLARAIIRPPDPGIAASQSRMAGLFRRYVDTEHTAPGQAAQFAWVAARPGVRPAVADLAPYLSTPADRGTALRMLSDIGRFSNMSAPLVISADAVTVPDLRTDKIIQVAVPDDSPLTRGHIRPVDLWENQWHRNVDYRGPLQSETLPPDDELPASAGDGELPALDSFGSLASQDSSDQGTLGQEPPPQEPPEQERRPVSGGGSSPPDAGSPELAVAEPIRRQLQGRLPEQVRLGDPVQLLVRVAMESGAGTLGIREALTDPLSIGPQGLTLSLTVEAPGLKPRSPLQGTVLVPASGNSGWELFEFDTTVPGVSTVTVMAFNGGARVGVLPMEITVDPQVVTGPPATRIAPVKPRNREEGDLSLVIRYDQAGGTYRYQLIDWTIDAPEEAHSAPLKETPKKAVESMVAQLNQVARRAIGWNARQTLEWLQGKGLELWGELIPQDLQNALLDKLDDIKCLMIYTDGDVVPWELLCPSPAEGFLVERCQVARWLKGLDGPVPRLNLRPAALALPQTAPSAAANEINNVRSILARCGSNSLPVARDLSALLEILQQHEFSVLHFASHNTFAPDAPDTSSIMFGAQPFVPSFLTKYQGDKYHQVPPAFQQQSPVIFMNACRTDGQAALFTELYGWAEKFLHAGAGAFIGSSWEVVDSSALVFAETFYDQLGSGATIGRAMMDARQRIHDVTGDPTWLAYTLYGDPKAAAVTVGG